MARKAKFVVVTGVDELDRKLRGLAPRARRRIVRNAVKAALGPVEAEAKARAPVRKGELRDEIGVVRDLRTKSRKTIGYEVAIKGSDGSPMVKHTKSGQRVFVPYAVEFGHSRAPAHPFMRPAFEAKGPGALAKCLALLRAGIEMEARR